MQTFFGRLSWHRAIEKFRRRRPNSPIRRGDINPLRSLDRLRLDDRIAPGSVFGTAAAQAIGLAGPLAWIGLDGTNMLAAPPAPLAESSANADGDSGDLGLPEFSSSFFSFTAPDDIPPVGSANQQLLASVGDQSADVSLTDLGEPGSQVPISPVSAGSVPVNNATPPAGGGTSNFAAPNVGAIRSGGLAVSGGPPTPPPPNTGGGPSSPVPHGAGDKATAAPAGPSGSLSTIGSTPASQPIAAPAGHFATQLQALFHSGDTGGTFSLSDTANQQSQIGALVGSQLTNATGLNSADAASHRPASLLGQTLADGSNQNLGLRTSDSSSGMFGLVGSQSIGDLVNGPTAGNQGGLANAAGAIASAIPAGTLPGIGAEGAASGVDRAAGLPGAVLTPMLTPSADSGDGSGMRMATSMDETEPPTDSANFLLTVEGGNPDYFQDGIGSLPWSVTEQGNIVFLSMEPGNEDYGPGYLQTELDASVDIYQQGSYGSLGLNWTGYATPAGILYGFDIDQFNQQEFGIDDSTATSYTLDTWGNDSTTAPDASSTQNQQTGTVTRQESDTVTNQNMSENFSLHVEGPGNDHQATWDNTITSGFNGAEYGSDVDATDPTVAPSTNDGFTDTDTDTAVEVDHTEGTIEPDGTFQLTSFSTDITSDDVYIDYVHGTTHAPEPGGSETDNSYDEDTGDDHEHLVISGSPDCWTTTLDDTDQSYFSDADTSNESSSQTTAGETDANQDSFNTGDSGTHTDALHIDGAGDATTFTANDVSDRIEDVYNFNDADINNPVDTTTTATDQDTDNYHFSDNGNADEVLTITGDANNLTAGYTDTIHDGFTDSDDIHDQWNGPDSADTGSDSGADHSTDGDNGSETAYFHAQATLPDWQADSTSSDDPTWQVTHVKGYVSGNAAVHSGDDGTDTDVEAANTADTDYDQYSDTSTGTDTFKYKLTGDGTSATLVPSSTTSLQTQSEDDSTDRRDDPTTLNGDPAVDVGSEQIDDTDTDVATVGVSQTETIDASGTITPGDSHVDVTDSSTIGLTDVGSETISDQDQMVGVLSSPADVASLAANAAPVATTDEAGGDIVLTDAPITCPGPVGPDDPPEESTVLVTAPTATEPTINATLDGISTVLLPGQDDESDAINDSVQVADGVHLHTDTVGGSTAVTLDQNLGSADPANPTAGGTINMVGSENAIDTLDSSDETTDAATGNLGGTIGGNLHQTGTIVGGQLTPTGSTGAFGLNLKGPCADTKKEFVATTPATFLGSDPIHGYFTAGGESVAPLAPPSNGSPPVRDPSLDLGIVTYPSNVPMSSKNVTVTTTVKVPSFNLKEDDSDTNGSWGLGDLNYGQDTINSTTVEGDYTNSLYSNWPMASGHGKRTDTTEIQISEATQADGSLKGSQTTIVTDSLHITNPTVSAVGEITGGTTSDDQDRTDTDAISGTEGPTGKLSANMTESHDVTGNGLFIFNYNWQHFAAGGSLIASGLQENKITSKRDYHDHGDFTAGPTGLTKEDGATMVPDQASGKDSVVWDWHINTVPVGGATVDIKYFMAAFVSYRAPGSPAVAADPTNPQRSPALPAVPPGVIGQETRTPSKWWETVTGQTPTNSDTYVPPQFDPRDWFAKTADFAAGMGDAVSCGLTQRIRSGLGYDDVVDKTSLQYVGGQVAGTVVSIAAAGANPCQAAAGIKLAIKTVSAVQGVGQLANAADAAEKGDPLGFVLNVVGARMSFGKLGQACFAAGTPLHDSWTTAKPIEQFRAGDMVLSRDENDPVGEPVLKQVEEVFTASAAIMHLHIGGQVIRTTAMHPFWVAGKGWLEAERLVPGDRLGSHDGQDGTVEELYHTGETETVYNLRIAEYHTYFVGCPEWGWSAWAHNDCHHIVSKYSNAKRGFSQNWTQKSQGLLNKGGIGVNSAANKVQLATHAGPHPELYHQQVYQRLATAAGNLRGASLTQALKVELGNVAGELQANPGLLSGIGL